MKKYLWLLLLIFPSLCYGAAGDVSTYNGEAVANISTIMGVSGASIATVNGKSYTDGDSSPCASYELICQNFETATTGWDNSETWTTATGTNGTTDPVDTTATILRGTQQLELYTGDAGQITQSYKTISVTNSGGTVTYFAFRYKTSDATPSATQYVATINNGSGTVLCALQLRTTGVFRVIATGGSNADTSGTEGTAADNTGHFIWLQYTQGTSDDASCAVYTSTTRTKPGSASATSTGGTSELAPDRFYVRVSGSSLQAYGFYDQVLGSASAIGDLPE